MNTDAAYVLWRVSGVFAWISGGLGDAGGSGGALEGLQDAIRGEAVEEGRCSTWNTGPPLTFHGSLVRSPSQYCSGGHGPPVGQL